MRTCRGCQKQFPAPAWEKANPARGGAKYCSLSCYYESRKNTSVYKTCSGCGLTLLRKRAHANRHERHFCSKACLAKFHCGERHVSWQGGRWFDPDGYVRINTGNGKAKYEHVLIAERALGRPIRKGEVVHHINGNKQDNRNSNLLICSASYHHWLHQKMSHLYQQEHFGKCPA